MDFTYFLAREDYIDLKEGNKVMTNPDLSRIKELLENSRTSAIVGASSNPARASHGIMKILMRAGYRVIPVNPNETEILGVKAYASLSDIPDKIDIVDVFRRAEDTPAIASQAVSIGAKTLWLQLGIASDQAAAIARQGGLNVIMDNCIAVTMGQLDVSGPV